MPIEIIPSWVIKAAIAFSVLSVSVAVLWFTRFLPASLLALGIGAGAAWSIGWMPLWFGATGMGALLVVLIIIILDYIRQSDEKRRRAK